MTQSPSLSRYWLLLGVTALAIAGLYSLVLVVARTPSLAELPLFAALFHEALVVHVDLSVLVWFLSIACLIWSMSSSGARPFFPMIEEAALISFALGTLAIAASPFDPKGQALMSNYIPVITSPVFFLGLGLLFCGVGLMLVKALLPPPLRGRAGVGGAPGESLNAWLPPTLTLPLRGGGNILSSALIALIAAFSFIWSYYHMPRGIDGQHYYELLFWGGGHVLQFLHVQVMMICWLMLAGVVNTPRWLFVIGIAASLLAMGLTMGHEVTSPRYYEMFTEVMVALNGIAPTILALFLIPAAIRARRNALWSALCMSILLFLYGGALGEMIRGQNVVIPAHYHGSIVGVTLAFMGAAYLLLPQFGYRDVSGWKMAFWQPVVYGGGQLLHISGLAWSGGYGVLRKTPGGMDALAPGVKAAMGLMGLGGMIAIIGGFMFVIVVFKSCGLRSSSTGSYRG